MHLPTSYVPSCYHLRCFQVLDSTLVPCHRKGRVFIAICSLPLQGQQGSLPHLKLSPLLLLALYISSNQHRNSLFWFTPNQLTVFKLQNLFFFSTKQTWQCSLLFHFHNFIISLKLFHNEKLKKIS